MSLNPKLTHAFIKAVTAGWEVHAADASFSGLTLPQFKARVQPSLDIREQIAELEQKLQALRVEREKVDAESDAITSRVVDSVKGHPHHGPNGALYASFGYVRKAARRTGRKRASNAALVQPVTELKVAA